MDYNEISVFLRVVQTGSFSQTAIQLGMPKSTVSHKVMSLEDRLGVTLIQRTTRKLNVTSAGMAYYDRCLQGFKQIQEAEEEVAAHQDEPRLLRITAPIELGSRLLSDLISQYTDQYSKVRVEVLLSDRLIDLLAEGVDLAIRAGELEDSSLIAKRIGAVTFAPYASPSYLEKKGNPDHPTDLAHRDCLRLTPMGAEEWFLTNEAQQLTIPVSSRIMINDLGTVKTLAARGQGVALIPTYFCQAEVDAGTLVRILPGWHSEKNPIHFVYPSQRFVTPKLSASNCSRRETTARAVRRLP